MKRASAKALIITSAALVILPVAIVVLELLRLAFGQGLHLQGIRLLVLAAASSLIGCFVAAGGCFLILLARREIIRLLECKRPIELDPNVEAGELEAYQEWAHEKQAETNLAEARWTFLAVSKPQFHFLGGLSLRMGFLTIDLMHNSIVLHSLPKTRPRRSDLRTENRISMEHRSITVPHQQQSMKERSTSAGRELPEHELRLDNLRTSTSITNERTNRIPTQELTYA